MLGAMFRHMFDRGVQSEALGALASFALAPRLAETLTPGGADAVVRSLERLRDEPGYTLHPAPHTLHPTPFTPHPAPHTLHPTPYTGWLSC